MGVINTTDVIDSSMFLKAKLDKNMVGSNYYIENLQHKRNLDWRYRYNVVGIEEELVKQLCYTNRRTSYTPIDAVITEVKTDRGNRLGSLGFSRFTTSMWYWVSLQVFFRFPKYGGNE